MERGYLLHLRPYRESSAIVQLLVDGQGRVDAVARLGSGKRTVKALLQPFQPLLFSLAGRGELKNLQQPEAYAPAVPLGGDALYAGMYLNELLIRCLSHGHAGEGLFLAYHQTLMRLALGMDQACLRYFELALLSELGTCPPLAEDALGNVVQADSHYSWRPQLGLAPDSRGDIAGHTLLALSNKELQSEQLRQAKLLLRQLLAPFVGDKPLASRELFRRRHGGNQPA
ncbi:DNA repair protein RecO [Shewanella cyperi]|uniref:DNA repair protein RecO n=1 Tax=Shewanella cyperi TaxID=2814292 RepID=UPI001A94BFE3|nr:DNA repair protein RecO [Shewanella cyperi]QSX41605.1 DNA repair protein RecO [Shewanella cyperi]